MAPLTKKQSQGFRSILSIRVVATLVGIVCLGIAMLAVAPSYAAAGKLKVSGGGCTNISKSKVCVKAEKGNAVASAVVQESTCPKSVEIKLFDNHGLVASTTKSGCGRFQGPSVALKAGDKYVAQVIIDGSAAPSPQMQVS